jgi:hypothetical protein
MPPAFGSGAELVAVMAPPGEASVWIGQLFTRRELPVEDVARLLGGLAVAALTDPSP